MSEEIQKLKEVIKALRHPKTGCPWDLEQTHESLLPFLIEEAYEYISAVESKSDAAMKDELGDVLLQVVLHAQLASERNAFTLDDVAQTLSEKMIRRHPHVFSDVKVNSAEDVKTNWQAIKDQEKKKSYEIDQSALHAPALTSSNKIGAKTRKLNFDWDHAAQVAYKVEEEWQELKEEIVHSHVDKKRAEDEIGDLLFSVAQLARHLEIDPELALRKANQKFIRRFNRIEDLIKAEGLGFQDLKQEELDLYWNKAKQEEGNIAQN